MRRRLIALVVLACLLAMTGADALANNKKRQRELNEGAVKALIDGDYPAAIEMLEESIEIGELNVTWLNLGRAYAKAGRCKDALVAYDRMAVAPRVDKPSAEELYEILTRYRQELVTECPGNVIVRCRPSSLTITVDGGAEMACPDGPLELAPGEHSFNAVQGGQSVAESTVQVEGMATVYVDLTATERAIDRPPGFDDGSRPVTRDQDGGGGAGVLDILGWSALGLGTGMLVAAAVVDGTVLSDHFEAFDAAVAEQDFSRAQALQSIIDTTQTIDLALYIAGASLAAVGTGLVIAAFVTAGDDDAPDDTLGAASFGITPGGASLVWTTRF